MTSPVPRRRLTAVAACGWALALLILGLTTGTAAAQAAPLSASFDYSPSAPEVGQTVAFAATTSGGTTAPIEHAWDLDGDGEFDDAVGARAQTSFAAAGSYVVRLRARQSGITVVESVAERTVIVGSGVPPADPPPPADPAPPADGNQPPVARYDRGCARQGTIVLCAGLMARESKPKLLDASLSSDPDGSIARYEWDLDGNGTFEVDGGVSPTVSHTFELYKGLVDPRVRTIAVRVTDDAGATAVDTVQLRLYEPACQDLVVYRGLELSGACIRSRNATADGRPVTRHYSKEPVTINGITLVPAGGARITIDVPRDGAPGNPRVYAGDVAVSMAVEGAIVPLYDGRIDWKAIGGKLFGFEVDATARLNGLRITGVPTRPTFGFGRARVDVHVAMPDQFGGTTSATPIPLRGGGARAAASEPLSFEVPSGALGPIGLSNLKVTYDGVDLWEIAAGVALPPPTDVRIDAEAGIRSNGDFDHAAAAVDFGSGVGPFGPVPIYLKRIAFRVELHPKQSECVPHVGVVDGRDYGNPSFALCGSVRLTGGPSILGGAAISLDGGLGFASFDDRPSIFRAFGDLNVVEIPVAHGEMEVHTDGYIRVGGNYRWGVEDVFTIKGGLDLELYGSKFNASAWGKACIDFVDFCRGMSAVISSKGVAVCLSIDIWVGTWTPGIGYVWGESSPDLYFDGCDIGDYKEHIDHATANVSAARERSIEVEDGLPGTVIAAQGKDAPPQITLIGPKGERITTPDGLEPVEDERYFLLKDPRANLTQVAINAPSGGRWRIVLEDGSSPLVSLRSAEGLPEPKVEAKVTGSGHRRTLRYSVAPLEGQDVTFIERGPSAGRRIGVAKGSEGTLAFTPADGVAERRDIVAVVEQDGRPRAELEVASYQAPARLRPARPRGVRVRRGRSSLAVSWRAVPRAVRYDVRVRLDDGRRLLVRTSRRRATLRRIGSVRHGSVSVRALSRSGTTGPAAKARLRAA
jgi:hypothetical protein